MKEHPMLFNREMVRAIRDRKKTQTRRPLRCQDPARLAKMESPYPYRIGDWLWVRETFAVEGFSGKVHYRADYDASDARMVRWTPSVHMPREYCRMLLGIEDVKMQNINTITAEEVKTEGFNFGPKEFRGVWARMYPKYPVWCVAITFHVVKS